MKSNALKLRNIIKFVFILVFVFLMITCDTGIGGKTGGVSGKTSTGTDLFVMDKDMLNSKLKSVSPDGTLTFDNLDAEYTPVKGDIICAGPSTAAPYGFLYKVTTVTVNGGETVITTEMATLEEAVEEADVEQSFYLDFEEGEEEEIEGVEVEYGYFDEDESDEVEYDYFVNARSMQRAASSTAIPLDKKAAKLSVDKELSGKVRVKGSLQISATIDSVIKIESFKMQKFELSTTPRIKADLEASVSGKIEGELKYTIYKKKLAPITFFAGPVPVVFVPEITVDCAITAEGEVELSVQKLASWDYSYVYGVRYLKGGSLDTFSRNTSKPAEFLKNPQLKLSGELKVEPRVGLMFGLYGAAYAGLSVGPYAKLAGEIGISDDLLNGKLSLFFGLDFAVNAKLEILSHEIGSLSKTFASPEWTIWERNGAVVYDRDTWNDVILGIKSGGSKKNYTINVTGNFSLPGVTANTFGYVTGLKVTITGNRTITLTGQEQGSLLYVGANQAVVIRDTDFVGNKDNNAALIYVYGDNAELTMEGNSSVSNNTRSSGNGGGVYFIGTNAIFTMKDSASVHNNENRSGYSVGYGGGVYFSGTNAIFSMKDKASVHNNSATFSDGGGVYIYSGTLNLADTATISGNTAYYSGGGLYVAGGIFNMTSGTISGNTAKGEELSNIGGGGVCVYSGGIFNMTSGIISGNTVTATDKFGGGVYVHSGIFHMEKGTIYGSNVGTNSNNANTGAALCYGSGAAERGTFSVPGDPTSTWTSNDTLSTTDYTLKVANGIQQYW
jgi:hypothetical protein